MLLICLARGIDIICAQLQQPLIELPYSPVEPEDVSIRGPEEIFDTTQNILWIGTITQSKRRKVHAVQISRRKFLKQQRFPKCSRICRQIALTGSRHDKDSNGIGR